MWNIHEPLIEEMQTKTPFSLTKTFLKSKSFISYRNVPQCSVHINYSRQISKSVS